MNGICMTLLLGLVATAAAYPYPSKQLRIRQVVVPPAGSGAEPEVPEPPSRFPPYDFGRKIETPKEEDPAEIVEVPDLDEHKEEEKELKEPEPFIIKPESNSEDEVAEVEGAEEEKKEEEEQKDEEKYEEEEKEKKESEEKEEYVEAPKPKEEEKYESHGENKEKKEDDSSSSEEEKSGEYEVKPEAEKDAEASIDPLVQAAHYDEDSHGKAELVPKAAPKPPPKPACGPKEQQFKQRVEAIIAELHEIKELCCKIEELEPKEEAVY